MARLQQLRPRVAIGRIVRAQPLTTDLVRLVPGSQTERAVKRAVARRSGGWCECASCRRSGTPLPAAEFDHVVPLWEGGTNDLANWQHLASDCHKAKSAAETRRRLGLT